MKNLYTNKLSGPPLAHDVWVKRQQELDAQAAEDAAVGDAAEEEEDGDEEPTFAGRKLSEFDGMTDEQILDIDGVGAGTLAKIKAAQAARP